MKKILVLFILLSSPAFAIPARLGGFSYRRDNLGRIADRDETLSFNDRPMVYDEEPMLPHYLNEDLSDARTGVQQSGDKYKLTPIYSVQELYDISNQPKVIEGLEGNGGEGDDL